MSPVSPANSTYITQLNLVSQPQAGTVTLKTRLYKDVSAGQVDYTVALKQGTTTIQSFTHNNVPATPTEYDDVITNTGAINWAVPLLVAITANQSA